jgi:hypothetical protein
LRVINRCFVFVAAASKRKRFVLPNYHIPTKSKTLQKKTTPRIENDRSTLVPRIRQSNILCQMWHATGIL